VGCNCREHQSALPNAVERVGKETAVKTQEERRLRLKMGVLSKL
jgi:hypothetical protein